MRRYTAGIRYQAATWSKPRRVVAKVEWHPGELYPRVTQNPLRGSRVTNLSRPAERVTRFYDGRGVGGLGSWETRPLSPPGLAKRRRVALLKPPSVCACRW